jgi:hypothetical protein
MTTRIQEFDYSINLLRALLWQDNRAPKLKSILQQKQDWYDTNVSTFWEDWVRDVFDIRTANEFGLAVWAIILGIPTSAILPPTNKPNFGFGSFNKNFNHGNFGSKSSTVVGLTLEQKRILLRLRYFKLISRCTVPEINRGMKSILGDQGTVYVLDANNMQFVTYVFGFQPNSTLQFVLQNFDVLPRPAAVGVRYVVNGNTHWGFGSLRKNFNHGNFGA